MSACARDVAVRRCRRQRQAHDVAFPRRRLENPQDAWASVDLIVNRIPLSEDVHQTGSSSPLHRKTYVPRRSRTALSTRSATASISEITSCSQNRRDHPTRFRQPLIRARVS